MKALLHALLMLAMTTPSKAASPWTVTGAMSVERSSHTATLLPTGKVLVTGGYGSSSTSYHSSAELYNAPTATWVPTGGLATARANHIATSLPNGKVLVAGGGNGTSSLSSSELYNPATGVWTTTGAMNVARLRPTATLLPNGKVLVAGGIGFGMLSSAEIYDPTTGTWALTGSMNAVRWNHTATLLSNGKVLVAGGSPSNGTYLSGAELYDPATGIWSPTGSMLAARDQHTATGLQNGKVLVTGGYNSVDFNLFTAELYEPTTGTWSATGSLISRNEFHSAALLPTGKVLVQGGYIPTAEIYDPVSGTWAAAGALNVPRAYNTLTLLSDGRILVTGGRNAASNTVPSAELYGNAAQYTVTPGPVVNGSITPNALQIVNGGGSVTFTATPNSGYAVDQWLVNFGVAQTGGTAFTVSNVTGDMTVKVTFKPATVPTYSITTSAVPFGGGSAAGGGTFDAGSSVTVLATPSAGYRFATWTEGGIEVSSANSYTFPAIASRTLVANFTLIGGLPSPGEAILHNFMDYTDPSVANSPVASCFPVGSLVAVGGSLYGVTRTDRTTGNGTIYRIEKDGTDYRLIHGFDGSAQDGGSPDGGLATDGAMLFGVTEGTIYKFAPDGTGYEVIYHFNANVPEKGYNGTGTPTIGGSTLYGYARNGGSFGGGVIYKVSTSGTGYQVLHHFGGTAGDGSFVGDPGGNTTNLTLNGSTLYGVTHQGGAFGSANGVGTIFRVNTDGSGYKVLHAFGSSPTDGRYPKGGLTRIGATLYGTAGSGGAAVGRSGVVFRINADGSGYRVLHNFGSGATDGIRPRGNLTASGTTLYGVTFAGGNSGWYEDVNSRIFGKGTVFKINVDGSGYKVIYNFGSRVNDCFQPNGVVFDGGTLYGSGGGGNTKLGRDLGWTFDTLGFAGTVFKVAPPNNNADLASLESSGGAPDPAFSSGITNYTQSVLSVKSSITVTPTVADSNARVKVNGVIVASGAASGPLPLKVGVNNIGIVVTAQDGTTKTYSLRVTRMRAPVVGSFNPTNGTVLPPVSTPGSVTLRGLVKDDVEVNHVLVSLNGGPPVTAHLIPGAKPTDWVKWDLDVQPENGVNVLSVQTVNALGDSSIPRTSSFRYQVVRPEVAGLYTGLATPTEDSTNPARQVGLSKVTVGHLGAFTGCLTLGGPSAPVTISATFGNRGDARFWVNKATTSTLEIKRTGLPSLTLALNLDVSAPLAQQITGILTENGTVVSTLTLNRQLYTAAKIPAGSPLMHVPASLLNPLTDKGAYTCIFQAIVPPNEGLPVARFPQGDGWALARVKSSGAATFAGRLADGQPFSYGNYLSKDNVLPFYLRPYAGHGTLSGSVSFRDVPGQSDADGVGLRWFKTANPKDTLYPLGWPAGIKVDVLGSKFVVPERPTSTNPTPFYLSGRDNILGLPGAPTPTGVTLVLADGGTPGISKAATVDAKNTVTIALPADALLNLKAAFPTDITGRLTGRLSGSFKHSGNNDTVTFGGVVYQKLHTASGYFLYYPPKPSGQAAPSGMSGSVGIAP